MAPFRSAPLWAQVLAIWGTAIPVGLLLALLDRWLLPPWRFYWLIPYPPSVWGWLRVFWGALRMRPLLITAVAVVPLLALLGTVTAISVWLVSRRVRAG
jgi:hypothetical protein